MKMVLLKLGWYIKHKHVTLVKVLLRKFQSTRNIVRVIINKTRKKV